MENFLVYIENNKIFKYRILIIILLLNMFTKNIYAVSEKNIIFYSIRIKKEYFSTIASDRFGDQSEDLSIEIVKKNINISKFQIAHKGTDITFTINFNSFNIEKGDKYMIDKCMKLPISEEITFDKYLMYRMVDKDYQPTQDDISKIIVKDENKILLEKFEEDYEITFERIFKIDVDAMLKNDIKKQWIINIPWEEDKNDEDKTTKEKAINIQDETVSAEKAKNLQNAAEDSLGKKARLYLDAKRKEEEEKHLHEENNAKNEKELKEKAISAIEIKRREDAIKKLAEQKMHEEEQRLKEIKYKEEKEKKKKKLQKENEIKQLKEDEVIREKARLLSEAKKRDNELKEKEIRKKEEEKILMEKRAQERARVVVEALAVKERKYKLDEEMKQLEEQARIQYDKKLKEEEIFKKEEMKRRETERKIEEERIKKMKAEDAIRKEEEKRKKSEEEKKSEELAKKKEEEKRIIIQSKVPGAIVSNEIICQKVFREPEINGRAESAIWGLAKPYAVIIKNKKGDEKTIVVKTIYTNNNIYFFVQWEDITENKTHKTWFWDKEKKQYKVGEDIEDKFDLMFALKNNSFTACMLSGANFEADLWEWGAAKTNPIGFADDQKIEITGNRIRRANSYTAYNGRKVWIKSIFDPGEPCYKQDIPVEYKWDKVPSYINQQPSGSRADIKAKGIWKDGIWMVEIGRKLTTNDKENDIQFNPNRKHLFALAIFNQQEMINHYTSEELVLIFAE